MDLFWLDKPRKTKTFDKAEKSSQMKWHLLTDLKNPYCQSGMKQRELILPFSLEFSTNEQSLASFVESSTSEAGRWRTLTPERPGIES